MNFPGRQTLEASRAIARLHQLDLSRALFIQQNPSAIDAGVFHNDVACVGHRNVLLLHEKAWLDQASALDRVRRTFESTCGAPLHIIQVSEAELPLKAAVETYLFNSQIVDRPDGAMLLIAPSDCRDHPAAAEVIARIIAADNPISAVEYVTVRQSMRNGGGPACLRLRIVLTAAQRQSAHAGVFLTPSLYDQLVACVEKHYPDQLRTDDLADIKLLEQSRAALDELTRILGLGAIYPFQTA